VDGGVEHAGLHAVLVEHVLAQRVAQVRIVHHHRHHVAGGAVHVGVLVGHGDSLQPIQQFAVAVHQPAPVGDLVAQRGQARAQQRRARLVHAVVEAQRGHVVARGVAAVAVPGAGCHRVGAALADVLGHVVVVGGHEPALTA
jgi:hypothetical protein